MCVKRQDMLQKCKMFKNILVFNVPRFTYGFLKYTKADFTKTFIYILFSNNNNNNIL